MSVVEEGLNATHSVEEDIQDDSDEHTSQAEEMNCDLRIEKR